MIKTEPQQKFHAQMLADVRDILTAHNVPAILTGSALLGQVRDGDLIKHCPGVVLTTFRKDIKPHEEKIIADLKKAGFLLAKHFINKNYKIRVIKFCEIQPLNVEIIAYSYESGYYFRQLKRKRKVIPRKLLRRPFSKITVRGQVYDAPHNVKKYLRFLYKNWKVVQTGAPSSYKNSNHMVMGDK